MLCSLHGLKQLGAASTASEYIELVNRQGVISSLTLALLSPQFSQRNTLQQQGYPSLLVAALENGLQLYMRCCSEQSSDRGNSSMHAANTSLHSNNSSSSSRGAVGQACDADSAGQDEQMMACLVKLLPLFMHRRQQWPNSSRSWERLWKALFKSGEQCWQLQLR